MTPEEAEVQTLDPVPMTIPVQTTYPSVQPIGVPGMPATMVSWDADTFIVDKAAAAAIPFARAVSLKAGSEKSIVQGGATGYVGVTYRDITLMANCPPVDGYPPSFNAGVCRRGDIWVDAKVAVDVTDKVGYDATTGQLSKTAPFISGQWMRKSVSVTVGGVTYANFALLRLEGPGYAA
jgi:hypothetical protein